MPQLDAETAAVGPIRGVLKIEYMIPGSDEALVVEHPLRDLARADLILAHCDRILHAVAETGTLQA